MVKLRTLLLAMLSLAIIAAGCSGGTKNNGGSPEASDAPGDSTPKAATVSFSYWGGDFDKQRMEAINEEFKKAHPEITVNLIQIPNDGYEQKMLATMASGQPYDVIQLAEAFYSYAAKDTLEDLTPYLQQSGISPDDYYQAGIDAYSYKDQIMAMPMRIGSMILLYNKNLFDQNNVDYPNENWTWDDFLNAAIAITDHDNSEFGLDWVGTWWASYLTWVHSFGGSLLSDDLQSFNLDSPESIEALQFIQDLIWKHNVTPQSNQWLEGVDMWTSGKMGMKIDGPWHILSSQANITDFEWDIAPVPKGAVEATPLFSNAFAIPKLSKNKDAAWEVVKFWTGKTGQEILAQEHGDIPPLKSVAESDIYLDLGGSPPANFRSMLTSAARAFAPQATIQWNEINSVADSYLGLIFNENKPVKETVEAMKPVVDQLLEDAKLYEQ